MKNIIFLIIFAAFPSFASIQKTITEENGMRNTRWEHRTTSSVFGAGINGHTYFITKHVMREHDELDCETTMAKVFGDVFPQDIRSAFFGMLLMSCYAPIDLNDTRKSEFEMVYVFEAFNEEEVPLLQIYLERIANFRLLKVPAPPLKMRWLHIPRSLHFYEQPVSQQEREDLGTGEGDEYFESLSSFYYRNLKVSEYVTASSDSQGVFEFLRNLFRISDREDLHARFQKSRMIGFSNWAGGLTDEKFEYHKLWNSTFAFGPGEVFRNCSTLDESGFCLSTTK
jgi:hypothetical protein